MTTNERIRQGIRKIAGVDDDTAKVYIASVDSVDEATRTCACTLISGDADVDLSAVNLMAEVNDGLLYIPTIGSTVMIESHDGIAPYITMWSQLDKVFQVAGGATFLIWSGGIELEGNVHGGLVQVIELTKKINNIEKLINQIIDALKTTVIALAPSGTYPLTTNPDIVALTDISPLTDRSDIENTKVQHGDGS